MDRRRRRWWTWGLTAVAALIVVIATLSLSFRFVMQAVPGYREQVQGVVARAVGRPTRIGSMTLTWEGLRPSLDVKDVALLDNAGKPVLQVSRLRLGFNLMRLAGADWLPDRVEVYGLALEADVDPLGHWSLRGFGGGGGHFDYSAALQRASRFDRVRLRNGSLLVHDAQLGGEPLHVGIADALLRRSGDRYTVAAVLTPPAELAARAAFNGELRGEPAQQASWQGRWTLDISGIRGWPWLARSLQPGVELQFDQAQLQVQGRVDGGHSGEIDLQAQAQAVTASRGKETLARITQLQAEAAAMPESKAWTTELRRLSMSGARGPWAQAQGRFHYALDEQGLALDASADGLRLDDLLPWLALWKKLPDSAARLRDVRGDVHDLALHYEQPAATGGAPGAARYSLHARLAGAALAASASQPGFSGLDALVDADQDGGHLQLQQAALQVQLPDVFGQPLPVQALSGVFAWKHTAAGAGAGWQIGAEQFQWQLLGSNGHGHFSLLLPQDAAAAEQLQLGADFSVDDVTALKPYMPRDWGAGTRDWLNRALQRGRVAQGHLQLDGPLADYPYVEKPDGHWILDLNLVEGTLAYASGWPAAEKLQAQLKFRGHGLQIESSGAQLGGNGVDHITAQIPDFRKALLTVDGSTHGEAQRYYTLLRNSPLKQKLSGLLSQTDASGPAAVDLHLEIPLDQDDPPVHASGTARFDGATLAVRGIDQPVRELRGSVAFDDRGVHTDALGGQVYGTALKAAIQPEAESPDGVLQVQADVPVEPADGLLAAFTPDWLRSRMSGTLHVLARMPFAGPHSGQLLLSSDLRGVATRLPPPLAKAAGDSLPLTVTVGEGGSAKPGSADALRVLVDAGDRIKLALRFARPPGAQVNALQTRAVEARLGPGEMPHADADGIAVSGAPAELDVEQWLGLIDAIDAASPDTATAATGSSGAAAGKGLAFRGADLTPQRLFYGGLSVQQPHLAVSATPAGWAAQLDGANAQGRIDFTRANGGRLQARLQRLNLEQLSPAPQGDGQADQGEPFDPNQAPVVEVACDALHLGQANLGRLSLRSSRTSGGQSLDLFKLEGGQLQANTRGTWLRRNGSSYADFSFDIVSNDLGKVLQAFGYAATMDAKDAHFNGALTWPQQPDGLSLAQAQGTLTLTVKTGSLNVVKPGAGRVLGLLNLTALPRRLLTLDFHDVVAKGLGFDSLTGTFRLADGQAQTSDLKLEAPSMKLEMNGRIGLAAHDYDQRITVYPNVTTGVTVGATLLGGPIAGGIALLAQEVFNKPFNALSQFSYHVTGSWDNPQVHSGKETPKPLPPASANAG